MRSTCDSTRRTETVRNTAVVVRERCWGRDCGRVFHLQEDVLDNGDSIAADGGTDLRLLRKVSAKNHKAAGSQGRPTTADFEKRLRQATQLAADAAVDALLVMPRHDLQYLLGSCADAF
jgi:hypothetical protein